jgi:hypothetical protein
MNKKVVRFALPAIAAIIAIGGFSYVQLIGNGNKTSSHIIENNATDGQTQGEPEFMDFYDPTFNQLVTDADLVVYGQIKKFKDKEEAVISGPAEDAVKAKLASNGSTMSIHVTPVEIDVKEVISGDAPSTIILRRSELSEPYEPDLKVGQKMIFVLKKINGEENTYKVMHPQATYFDVDDKGKIKPYFKKFNDLSEISIKDFKEKVKEEKRLK